VSVTVQARKEEQRTYIFAVFVLVFNKR